MVNFIEGVPEGLERHLASFTSFNSNASTNITLEELRASVRGYIPNGGWSYIFDGKPRTAAKSEHVYFFFPKQDDSIDLLIGNQNEMHVALQRDNYGFSPDRVVRINPSRLELSLSEKARETYEGILRCQEIGIAELLEAIGFIVNHSMAYDFEKIRKLEEGNGQDSSKWNEPQKNYRPTGEEVMKGTCADAGKFIRAILGSLGMEDRFKYTYVSASNHFASHDTTVVFDKLTGEWAVINSKSPIKPYNLTPKERLIELGSPYVT